MSGYVRIHRTLIGHPAFRNGAEAMAFAWLVMRAQWKPTRVRYKERTICLNRGQLAVSQRDMAKALDRDKAWIERLWKRLRAEAMINVASEAGVAVITICKYDEYQSEPGKREAANEAGREAGARQAQGTEQGREEREEVSSEAIASSLPARKAKTAWPCPAEVDPEHWSDLMTNRKSKRLGFTPTAHKGQLRLLGELSDDEWPPGRLVKHAAEKGWGAIHDPRDQRHERPVQSTNRTADAYRTLTQGLSQHEPF